MITMTWGEWETKYRPIRNPNSKDDGFWGHMFETFGEDLDHLQNTKLPNTQYWTMVDGGGVYYDLVSGAQWVDRLGYFITEEPWEEDVYVTNQEQEG